MRPEHRIRFPQLGRGISFSEASILIDWLKHWRSARAPKLARRIEAAAMSGEDTDVELDSDDVETLAAVFDGCDVGNYDGLRLLQQAVRHPSEP